MSHTFYRCIFTMATLLVAVAANAAERVDFVTGDGTNGWTVAGGNYSSPTYANAAKQIRLEYTSGNIADAATIYATTAQGGESQIAKLTGASPAVTLDFSDVMDFRSFRIVTEGDIKLSSFTVSLYASQCAFPLSLLLGNSYTQDFDALAALTVSTGDKDWLNGLTLQYWQAWKGVNPVTSFKYNGGKIRTGGIYALATDQTEAKRALGGFSTKDAIVSFGMVFTNDTDRTMKFSGISYQAQQWGFANTNEQRFALSYMATNRLDWMVNLSDGWNECCVTMAQCLAKDSEYDVPLVTQVECSLDPMASIAPGQLFMLKWTLHSPASGSSSLMAIDDLNVRFAWHDALPLTIHIVDNVMK